MQARVGLRRQGTEKYDIGLFGSDSPDAIQDVAGGEVQLAIINPATILGLALRGTGPFKKPIPVRTIAVIPSPDQFGFAVSKKTGLTSLSDIRERRYPLRVSLRGEKHHSAHLVVEQVLAAAGFSLEDIVSWGGKVRYDSGLPDEPTRIDAVARGEIDAIFDEAVTVFSRPSWVAMALELEMSLLSMDAPLLQKLEGVGFRRAIIPKVKYPKLDRDIATVDFSGWAIYTHAETADELITLICTALEARKNQIPWQGDGPLPLERMCQDTAEAPISVPLHPAAETFWRSRDYLK
jgi:TRAP-type uncharacterized transport system substrate-binding protein